MGELLSGIGKPSIRHDRRHRGPNNLLKTENIHCPNLCEDNEENIVAHHCTCISISVMKATMNGQIHRR